MSWYCVYEKTWPGTRYEPPETWCELGYDCDYNDCPYRYSKEDYECDRADFEYEDHKYSY